MPELALYVRATEAALGGRQGTNAIIESVGQRKPKIALELLFSLSISFFVSLFWLWDYTWLRAGLTPGSMP